MPQPMPMHESRKPGAEAATNKGKVGSGVNTEVDEGFW